MSEIRVTGLNYYPVKACAGVALTEATFTENGITHDREWMLRNANTGTFLSQRNAPELAVVQTRIADGALRVNAPGMGDLAIPLERDPDAIPVPVSIWKRAGSGIGQGSEADEYFSDYLRRPAAMLRVAQPRPIMPQCQVQGASAQTGFADGFPMLLASQESLAALNSHLDQPVPIDRFRANILVEGAPAYDEDYWREVRMGALRAFVVRACARCPVPEVDQTVGILPAEQPIAEALRATHAGIDHADNSRGVFFGQNVTHVFEPGVTICVGDELTVVERAAERNFFEEP